MMIVNMKEEMTSENMWKCLQITYNCIFELWLQDTLVFHGKGKMVWFQVICGKLNTTCLQVTFIFYCVHLWAEVKYDYGANVNYDYRSYRCSKDCFYSFRYENFAEIPDKSARNNAKCSKCFQFLCNHSDRTWFFNALTFARSLGRCWKPRPPASASVFMQS